MPYRNKKLGNLIQKELSFMLLKGIKDPRISQFCTITEVSLTKDLRFGTIYVSVYGNAEAKNKTLEGLKSACGYIKNQLGQRIRMKYMPELVFKLDESIERGVEFYHKIEQIIDEDKKKGLIEE